jgi:oxaloacetate decarboxylase alpha subunit
MKNKYTVAVNEKEFEVTLIDKQGDTVSFELGNQTYTVSVEPKAREYAPPSYALNSGITKSAQPRIIRQETTQLPSDPNSICSPLPGIVAKMLVKIGDEVSCGQPVVIIEAMKMENVIASPWNGVISEIFAIEGAEVRKGEALLR